MRAILLALGALTACAQGAEVPHAEKRAALCDREGADRVRDVFCAEPMPSVRSLAELRDALRLGSDSDAQHSFLGHSTALSGELISPINPRMFALSSELMLAFNRGIQQVELAALDRASQRMTFYLLQFAQACSRAADGCSAGDLYTARIEDDWTGFTLQDDEDLKNTASDCRQCHQRGVSEPVLLMRELEGPWTHFFAPEAAATAGFPEPGGNDLLHDYLLAKGEEAYGGVPTELLRKASGFALQSFVSPVQPLVFEGAVIAEERWPWNPEGYPSEAQRSATWDTEYDAFKRGERLALPYFAARASDPHKQAQLTAAYQDYRKGELRAEDLPDLSDIYPDDAQTRAEIGLQTEPGATPVELLIQACGPCHNDVLDQSISRARFSIALERIGGAERALALERIQLGSSEVGAMPPRGSRQLDGEARARLAEYLSQSTRPHDDNRLLERAAALGMAVPKEERTQ